ncbi:MAG: cation diffusion facilitator family transporter [bacterium]
MSDQPSGERDLTRNSVIQSLTPERLLRQGKKGTVQWVRRIAADPETQRLYRQAIIITLLGNVVLAAGKAIAAYFSGSVALYADAANSISDVVYSLMIALGMWLAQRPPDLTHPQGHNRFEPLIGLVVAASITFAGYEAARSGVERLISGATPIELGFPALVLVGSVIIKSAMFLRIRAIARKLANPTFAAAAQDNLSDVLTSTAAFLGALGSLYISPVLDPVAAFVVAIWIFRTAFFIWRENLGFLSGAGASRALREQIVQVAAQTPGVQAVHQVITDYVGTRLVVDLHVEVAGDIHLDQAHVISDEVSHRLQDLPEVDRAYVHLEPVSKDH